MPTGVQGKFFFFSLSAFINANKVNSEYNITHLSLNFHPVACLLQSQGTSRCSEHAQISIHSLLVALKWKGNPFPESTEKWYIYVVFMSPIWLKSNQFWDITIPTNPNNTQFPSPPCCETTSASLALATRKERGMGFSQHMLVSY